MLSRVTMTEPDPLLGVAMMNFSGSLQSLVCPVEAVARTRQKYAPGLRSLALN